MPLKLGRKENQENWVFNLTPCTWCSLALNCVACCLPFLTFCSLQTFLRVKSISVVGSCDKKYVYKLVSVRSRKSVSNERGLLRGEVNLPEWLRLNKLILLWIIVIQNLLQLDPEDCLKERKWWCFLLSSILTFLMGVTGVFVMRVLKFVFCREVVIVVNMTPLKLYLPEWGGWIFW